MTRVRTREWSSTDYYGVLGVHPDAPSATIDATYRDLAKALHPDRNADPDDQERFKQISVAYAALKDPSTRAAYDGFRAAVAAGALYRSPGERRGPQPSSAHLAPARVPKVRRPVPVWLRHAAGVVLALLGLGAALWAAVGELPSTNAADTPVAVQITLAIVALKLMLCAGAVTWYPHLRARFARPQLDFCAEPGVGAPGNAQKSGWSGERPR